MTNFSIGLSALRSSQFALNVISNNIANANTPGYHRRNVHFASLEGFSYFGQHRNGMGVAINDIERVRSSITETALTRTISDASFVDQTLLVERQLEFILSPGDASIQESLDNLYAELTKLTSTPDEPTQRTEVIGKAQELSEIFQRVTNQLSDLRLNTRYQIQQEVTSVNDQLDTLSKLDVQISNLRFRTEPSQELDDRDQLINQIAQVIDVTRQERADRGLGLSFGGTSIQKSSAGFRINVINNSDGTIGVLAEASEREVKFNGGRLPALIELHNETIPKYEAKLNEIASQIIREFDQVHATGLGTSGSFATLNGSRGVQDINAPLATAGTVFPVEAGELYFSIVDPNGTRRLESITIDPDTQSLNDVADEISQIENLTALVDPQTNQLRIMARPGYEFDFTGSLESHPELDNFSGTSIPAFGGRYTDNSNQEFTFQILGSGDVGISQDLFVSVYDENGTLVANHSIGQGYEAGSPIDLENGVSLSFPPGTVVDGDSFETEFVNNPDTTGFLSAIGLNGFFSGKNARDIEVSKAIRSDPGLLAAGKSDDPADTGNLFPMLDLRHQKFIDSGRLTFGESINEMTTELGASVRNNSQLSLSLNSLKLSYEDELASISGVDINEEMVRLQQFQTSYEAAVRVIQTADAMMDELFNVLN